MKEIAELNKKIKTLEEANNDLHSIREVFLFKDLETHALKQGYTMFSLTMISKPHNTKWTKVSMEYSITCTDHRNRLKSVTVIADTLEELESKFLGNAEPNCKEDML